MLGRQLELIVYDGKTDAATIGNAATQLVESKRRRYDGLLDTDMTLAAAPIAAKAGVTLHHLWRYGSKIAPAVPDFLYLACFGDNARLRRVLNTPSTPSRPRLPIC